MGMFLYKWDTLYSRVIVSQHGWTCVMADGLAVGMQFIYGNYTIYYNENYRETVVGAFHFIAINLIFHAGLISICTGTGTGTGTSTHTKLPALAFAFVCLHIDV